jgi:hypothetical protein
MFTGSQHRFIAVLLVYSLIREYVAVNGLHKRENFMPLPLPREGEPLGFRSRAQAFDETTIGDPEQWIWSSIKQWGVIDFAEHALEDTHQVSGKRAREGIADNLRLYIGQAFDLYQAAGIAKANTAPLMYYYSFLNLAKALCEIRNPRFHKMAESYRHGIGWRPKPDYLVNMRTESVNLISRGVWHVLYEALTQQPCRVPNPCTLSVDALFGLNPEIGLEYEGTYNRPSSLVELYHPDVLVDFDTDEVWIRFSVERQNLKSLRLSRPKLLAYITVPGSTYRQVRSLDPDLWTFELDNPKKIPTGYTESLEQLVAAEVSAMHLFVYLHLDGLEYVIPIQTRLPLRLPQLLVLYSLMFWLGSLVRYDPHSVADLQESEYWLLIDGFMSQSRLWLLEMFEWELFRAEIITRSAR